MPTYPDTGRYAQQVRDITSAITRAKVISRRYHIEKA
jgi:hypothetical protein